MCGISGKINFDGQPVSKPLIRSMMHAMNHRGPDDTGTYFSNNIGLGFVRLSIIDLSFQGHQPMHVFGNRAPSRGAKAFDRAPIKA